MSRQIKFRAWNKRLKVMGEVDCLDYGDTVVNNTGEICGIKVCGYWFRKGEEDSWGNLDNLELMQFTGLLDKNGKEIYEGDIIKEIMIYDNVKDVEKYYYNCKVGFINGGFMVEFEQGNYPIYLSDAKMLNNNEIENIEVIGNIFENSDLIK